MREARKGSIQAKILGCSAASVTLDPIGGLFKLMLEVFTAGLLFSDGRRRRKESLNVTFFHPRRPPS
jgi:hypothetical protein